MASLKWISLTVLALSGTAAALCNILLQSLFTLVDFLVLLLAAATYISCTIIYLKKKKKDTYIQNLKTTTAITITILAAIGFMGWAVSGSFFFSSGLPLSVSEPLDCWGINEGQKEYCYYNLAVKQENISYCNNLRQYSECDPTREECVQKIAPKIKNPALCEELDEGVEKQYCQAITTKNCSLCPPCPKGGCYYETHNLIESCPQILDCPTTDCNCQVFILT